MVDIKTPKGQKRWVIHLDENGEPKYIITSTPMRDWYYLYSVDKNGDTQRVAKSRIPVFKEIN